MSKLSEEEIGKRLIQLKKWTLVPEGKAIERQFVFADFKEAFAFMTQTALKAEVLDHHPDWSNAYNRVDVTLTTHSEQGLSPKDFTLAEYMDSIYSTSSSE